MPNSRALGHRHRSKSPFSYYIRKAKDRKKDCDIDLTYLESLWNKQGGKCAFTGLPLQLWTYRKSDHITQASLDRIDSSKGYVQGNVQFVSACLNLAKQTMSDVDFRNGFKRLVEAYRNVA